MRNPTHSIVRRITSAVVVTTFLAVGPMAAQDAAPTSAPVNAASAPAKAVATVTSEISAVDVFPGWARITRTVKTVATGTFASIEIVGLPAWLDTSSVQAVAKSASVLGVQARVEKEKPPESKVEIAEEALEKLQADVKLKTEAIDKQLQALAGERENINKLLAWKLGNVTQEETSRIITESELKALAELNASMRENNNLSLKMHGDKQTLANSITDAVKAIEELKKEEEEQKTALKQRGIITVEIGLEKPGPVAFEVSYLVPGAVWFPSYELQDSDANALALTASAVVRQITGENWDNVKVSLQLVPTASPLSTALFERLAASVGAEDEDLKRAHELFQQQLAVAIPWLHQGVVLGMTGEYLAASGVTVPSAGPLVPTTSKVIKMPTVRRYTLAAPQYRDAAVYGKATNPLSTPLLAGPITIAVRNESRRTTLAIMMPGDTREFMLGRDERITVARELLPTASNAQTHGDIRHLDLGYHLKLKNSLAQGIDVTLSSDLPAGNTLLIRTVPASIREGAKVVWHFKLNANSTQTTTYDLRWSYPAANPPELAQLLEQRIKL